MSASPFSFVRRLLACALALVALGGANAAPWAGVPVLMYHKVDPNTPKDAVGRDLTLDPAAFEAQLAWLRDHRIRTITTAELVASLARGEHPRDVVVLTFDDGYADAATYVTPLLRKYGMRASFYVSAGFVGDGRHASWRELRAMRDAGMEVACHGTRHLDLTTLDRAAEQAEIGTCVEHVRTYLGVRPRTYVYAAGKWNAAAREILAHDGVKAALTEEPGVVRSLADPFELPRRRIHRDDGLTTFAALATP
jgi:peptidoglycan/xylan/chitin deacetylase (PgdA/CDA1 family)